MLRLALVVALLPWWGPALPQQSQTVAADVITQLIGRWEGEGELFSRPATFSMRWSWELDRQFVRLSFENRLIENGESRTVLRATAYYRVADSDEYHGTWFDSRGQILELNAKATESTLIARWFANTEQGRTTYRVTGEGALQVHDEVHGSDGWRLFGEANYHRTEAE